MWRVWFSALLVYFLMLNKGIIKTNTQKDYFTSKQSFYFAENYCFSCVLLA